MPVHDPTDPEFTALTTLAARGFDDADETRTFAKGWLELVRFGGSTVGRMTFEPGWRWSECLGPVAGTRLCQAAHLGYVLSGRMHVVMDDGASGEAGPGDAFIIAPGHDAWVVGDEPVVLLDFEGVGDYARER